MARKYVSKLTPEQRSAIGRKANASRKIRAGGRPIGAKNKNHIDDTSQIRTYNVDVLWIKNYANKYGMKIPSFIHEIISYVKPKFEAVGNDRSTNEEAL